MFSMNMDGDLTMHQLRPSDAGMYTCFKGDAHEATYFIGVDDVESRIRVGLFEMSVAEIVKRSFNVTTVTFLLVYCCSSLNK